MVDFLTTNWIELAGIIALGILIFERVARLTPTESDDRLVQWVRTIANVAGLNFPDIKAINKTPKEEVLPGKGPVTPPAE